MPHAEIEDVYYKFGKHTGERMETRGKIAHFLPFFPENSSENAQL